MTVFRNDARAILSPADVGPLLIEPVLAQSIAAQVCTVVQTDAASFRIPRLVDDGGATWVEEGDEIPMSDPQFAELVVTPSKVARITSVSAEAAADTNPAASEVIGDSISRVIVEAVDRAFLGAAQPAPAPQGLASVTGTSDVFVGTGAFTTLDAFAEGASLAEQVGAPLTSWLINPQDALELAQVKAGSNSAVPLLTATPGQASQRTVEGLPLVVSRYVPAGVIYGVVRSRAFMIVRQDAEVVTDASVLFSSDSLAIRGVMRVGFGLPQAESVVRIVRAAKP